MTTEQALEVDPRAAQHFINYPALELNELYIEDGGDYWPLPASGDATAIIRGRSRW